MYGFSWWRNKWENGMKINEKLQNKSKLDLNFVLRNVEIDGKLNPLIREKNYLD